MSFALYKTEEERNSFFFSFRSPKRDQLRLRAVSPESLSCSLQALLGPSRPTSGISHLLWSQLPVSQTLCSNVTFLAKHSRKLHLLQHSPLEICIPLPFCAYYFFHSTHHLLKTYILYIHIFDPLHVSISYVLQRQWQGPFCSFVLS